MLIVSLLLVRVSLLLYILVHLNEFLFGHYLYDDMSQYLPKTVLYFCKRTVLKVLCYQNIYAEKDGRNMHKFIDDSDSEKKAILMSNVSLR